MDAQINMIEILTTDLLRLGNIKGVGPKAINLAKLEQLNFFVPSFVVIPASSIQKIDEQGIQDTLEQIASKLPLKRFAVRSAALIEDTETNSFAGQFLTRTDISVAELNNAILEVIQQAKGYLKGDLSKFSIIVQEYIEAEVSGVTFTRHPQQKRQMLIEYHRGAGEALVSGSIKPKKIELFWNEPLPTSELPFHEVIPSFKQLEEAFNHPQDIEWCYKNGVWYFLQTRPITTITSEQHVGLQYLDQVLPTGKPFLFEQTEVSEITPRPTPFTLSLIKKIYSENGPIQRVYKKYHVDFEPKNFLRTIGNQLYIDREEELKTLLPSYSYFGKTALKPSRVTYKNFWKTLKNQHNLSRINSSEFEQFFSVLDKELNEIPANTTLTELWKSFDRCYAIIFEINLLAGTSIQLLDRMLKPHHKKAVEILSSSFRKNIFNRDSASPQYPWKGNTLEISDEEPFVAITSQYHDNEAIDTWWNSLSKINQSILKPFLERAIAFNILRERGRWLAVGYMNAFRTKLENDWFFCTIDECEKGVISHENISKRKSAFAEYQSWTFPSRLTNVIVEDSIMQPLPVSAGLANGVLVAREQLDQSSHLSSAILYTETLTPDLVKYFDRIKGIASMRGGILSHLAILAREQGIPVLVNVDLNTLGLSIGDTVQLDCDKGELKKAA